MFNGSGKAIDKGPAVMAEDFLDIQGVFFFLIIYVRLSKFILCEVQWSNFICDDGKMDN